jgi:hypothetical protein
LKVLRNYNFTNDVTHDCMNISWDEGLGDMAFMDGLLQQRLDAL